MTLIYPHYQEAPKNPVTLENRSIALYITVNYAVRTSLFSRTLGIMVDLKEIINFYGRTIQVSELL